MRSALAVVSVLVLAAASAHAQYAVPQGQQSYGVAGMEQLGVGAKQTGKQPPVIFGTAPSSLCPISMDARQGGGLHILRAKKGEKAPEPGMMPTLTLRGAGGKHIVSANITAYGYSAPEGATPLQTGTGQPPDLGDSLNLYAVRNPPQRRLLNRTLTVQFEPDNSGEDYSEFHLPGFVTLTSIRLNAVTYADGTIWNVAAPQSCRVSPSPLMLVGAESVSPGK